MGETITSLRVKDADREFLNGLVPSWKLSAVFALGIWLIRAALETGEANPRKWLDDMKAKKQVYAALYTFIHKKGLLEEWTAFFNEVTK